MWRVLSTSPYAGVLLQQEDENDISQIVLSRFIYIYIYIDARYSKSQLFQLNSEGQGIKMCPKGGWTAVKDVLHLEASDLGDTWLKSQWTQHPGNSNICWLLLVLPALAAGRHPSTDAREKTTPLWSHLVTMKRFALLVLEANFKSCPNYLGYLFSSLSIYHADGFLSVSFNVEFTANSCE